MGKAKKNTEQHPYFPSGMWEGFYLYGSGRSAQRHMMSFRLDFKAGKVTGNGADDVGAFAWAGVYDVTSMAVTLMKSYSSHQVGYRGMADESGIYGSWEMPMLRGGFHIWPKKEEEKAAQEVVSKKKVLAVT